MKVAFINENTLGHASYLLPFVRTFRDTPELGIFPTLVNATPLPSTLGWWANVTVPGLRRWGLDFHLARWRHLASHHVNNQMRSLTMGSKFDAIVANTQSVALGLVSAAEEVPVFVCLDATFAQLARTPWFAPTDRARSFLRLTAASLRWREQALFKAAHTLLPWSEAARQSLLNEYEMPEKKVAVLPPSIVLPPSAAAGGEPKARPQILFVGGDFKRKGGALLLDCFRAHFAGHCDLHVVTQSDVPAEAGVYVHRDLVPHSNAWLERWHQADVFVFPSTLETFGIVLVEAIAFEVPVVSADVGAAREILADGAAGWLLPSLTKEALAEAIGAALARTDSVRRRVELGRQQAAEHFNLATNAARLAGWLRQTEGYEFAT